MLIATLPTTSRHNNPEVIKTTRKDLGYDPDDESMKQASASASKGKDKSKDSAEESSIDVSDSDVSESAEDDSRES